MAQNKRGEAQDQQGLQNLQACIYLRISRDKGEDVDSLRNHRDRLTALAEKEGYNHTVYADGVASSVDGDRAEYNRMIQDIKQGHYSRLYVHDIDRLSRSSANLLSLAEILEDHCSIVVTPTAEYDLKQDSSALLFGLGSVLASAEYRQIKKRLMLGKLAGTKEGRFQNSVTPFGYKKDTEGKLVPDEAETQTYREIIDMALNGMSYNAIVNKLEKRGITRRTGTKFHPNAIKRLIDKPVYRGILEYSNTMGSVRAQSAHTALLSEAEYQLLQEMAHNRATSYNRTRQSTPYITSAMLICAECGTRLTMNSTYNPVYKDGQVISKRRCDVIRPCKGCGMHGNSLEMVEQALLGALKNYAEAVEDELRKLKLEDSTQLVQKYHSRIKETERSISKVEDKIDNLVSLAVDGLINRETFKQRQDKLTEEKENLQELMQSYEANLLQMDSSTYEQRLKHILSNLTKIRTTKEIYSDNSMTKEEQREQISNINTFFKSVISRVEYKKEGKGVKHIPQISIEWTE
ncbi:recombinase family protein [Salinicoccus roseus]|uniref:recombinase family protein n=1 Tax=Salinicoccus roseus TaxID=45670 RepID=UPI001CA73395|nr:recombinase family protein [Salinicoccus roseus]MBY8908871.1 recombinase family protein [Salinicoccus roseus]